MTEKKYSTNYLSKFLTCSLDSCAKTSANSDKKNLNDSKYNVPQQIFKSIDLSTMNSINKICLPQNQEIKKDFFSPLNIKKSIDFNRTKKVVKSRSSLSKGAINCQSSAHLLGLIKKPITNSISKELISRSPSKINKNLSKSEIKSPKGKNSYKTVSSKPSLNNPSMSDHLSNKQSLSKCTSRQLIKNFSKGKIVEMNSFWKKNLNSEINSPTHKENLFEIHSLSKNALSSIQLSNSNTIKRNLSEKGFKTYKNQTGCNDLLDNLLEKYFENKRSEVDCNIEQYKNNELNEDNDFTLSPIQESINKLRKSQENVFIKNKYKILVQKYC